MSDPFLRICGVMVFSFWINIGDWGLNQYWGCRTTVMSVSSLQTPISLVICDEGVSTFWISFSALASTLLLKVVSTTFLVVCFWVFKNTSETRKNVFYFTSKALSTHGKIKFWNFRLSNFMMSWLNNLGSKHSLLMKFGQCMSYPKRNNFIRKLCKNRGLKTSSKPFCVCKELCTISSGKWNFWSNLLILDMY